MRKFMLLGAVYFSLLVSCESEVNEIGLSCEDHADHIYVLEKDLAESGYQDEKIRLLLVSYANYANKCVGDTLVPEFLFRRADVLRGQGKIRQAIKEFKGIHDGYPNFDKKSTCAFLTAFLYETELNDDEMAKKLYLQVVELYPDSHEAEVASIALQFLGETPEELMNRLQKNE